VSDNVATASEVKTMVEKMFASKVEDVFFFRCLDLHHTSPDSGERQYKSRT
jgi:hypothetical protein